MITIGPLTFLPEMLDDNRVRVTVETDDRALGLMVMSLAEWTAFVDAQQSPLDFVASEVIHHEDAKARGELATQWFAVPLGIKEQYRARARTALEAWETEEEHRKTIAARQALLRKP